MHILCNTTTQVSNILQEETHNKQIQISTMSGAAKLVLFYRIISYRIVLLPPFLAAAVTKPGLQLIVLYYNVL